jgi:hypothetical protein
MSGREREMAQAIELAESEDDEDSAEYVRPVRAGEPAQVYSVRVPVDLIEQLRAFAANRGVRPTTLIRQWVIERLEVETRSVVIHQHRIDPQSRALLPAELKRAASAPAQGRPRTRVA